MKTKYIYSFLGIASLVLINYSCSDKVLDEIDNNPNLVTDAPITTILPKTTVSYAYQVSGGSGAIAASFFSELTTFVLGTGNINAELEIYSTTPWNGGYRNLNDLRVMKQKAESSERWSYAGIADVLTALTLSGLTDLFGDVPYGEALQPDMIRNPGFDPADEVYDELQLVLDNAIDNLDRAAGGATPGNDDLVFNGNIEMWKKTAYGLKARLYNRLSNIDPSGSATLALEAIANSFAVADENFIFDRYVDELNNDNPFSGAQIEQPQSAIGNGIYNVMLGFIQENDIEQDPRAGIWFTRVNGQIIPAPNGVAEADFGEPRLDGAVYSKPETLKHRAAPQPLLTYVELKFIEAEARLRLGQKTTANEAYEEAVSLALQEAALFNPSVALPMQDINDYLDRALVTPGPDNLTLEHIIHQKYIYLFLYQPIEAYNEFRRTGLFSVTDPQGMPNRLPYPDSERSKNPNTPADVNVATVFLDDTKLFWAK